MFKKLSRKTVVLLSHLTTTCQQPMLRTYDARTNVRFRLNYWLEIGLELLRETMKNLGIVGT